MHPLFMEPSVCLASNVQYLVTQMAKAMVSATNPTVLPQF